MKPKKTLLSVLISLVLISAFSGSCFAIVDTPEDTTAQPLSKKELRKQKRLQHKAEKEAKKQEEALLKEKVNKNILRPNESPGLMTDTDRTRRYFESLEDAHRVEMEEELDESIIIDEEPLKLPARIEKNAATTKINKLEISNSEIFSDTEMAEFASLVEGQELTAEDINNFVQIINNQYAKKKIITARAYLESLENGILKI